MSRVEPPDLPSDVIARALDGDAAAFRRFHARYDSTVRWAVGLRVYCWPQLVPQLEDIVQEVWLELTRRGCKRLRYHDATRGLPFSRFVALVSTRFAWRIAKRQLGHATEELVDVLEDDDWGFAMRIMHADFLHQLATRVEQTLGATDRRLFEGYYIRGERLKDVGAQLDMNENATYKRKERLQKKLQGLAEALLGEAPGSTPAEVAAMVLGLLLALVKGGLGGGLGGGA